MMNRNILNPMMWTTGSGPTPPSPVSPGIYWNASRGLISLSSDGESWTTIADKNLGATEVYNYGDTLSQNNCGNYYQRGNNYGFPFSGGYTKRAGYVTARNYGPYYESNIFISGNTDWALEYNGNLRANSTTKQGPAPDGYHVPSKDDFSSMMAILKNIKPLAVGVYAEYIRWLKLPLAGYLYYNNPNQVTDQGTKTALWSTTIDASVPTQYLNRSYALTLSNTSYSVGTGSRANGCSVRCFRNEPIAPDNTWTTIYEDGNKGVYWNAGLELITITDGNNMISMQDKNLGATAVYSDGDTLSETNCGYYFQRGNNYGFPGIGYTDTIQTSSTRVDATNYGPYYYGTTFYTPFNYSHVYWDDSHNKNLRGGVTNTLKAMRGPCQEGYHIPNNIEFEGLWNMLQGLGLPKNGTTTRDYLKIPRAGHISGLSGQIIRVGEYCIVWTATASDRLDNSSWADDMSGVYEIDSITGANIRPFLNNSVTPDSTWTKLF